MMVWGMQRPLLIMSEALFATARVAQLPLHTPCREAACMSGVHAGQRGCWGVAISSKGEGDPP